MADRELATRAWDLDACNRAYAELLERYQPGWRDTAPARWPAGRPWWSAWS